MGVTIGVAMDRAFDGTGDDLRVAVVAIGVYDQRRDQQWHVHHLPVHGWSPPEC
jgi:hypothetical protein